MIEAKLPSKATSSSKPITIHSSSPSPATPTISVKTEDDESEYEDIEDDEEDEKERPVTVKKEKKDTEDEDTGEPTAPRSMCLRCSKQLRSNAALRCTRPTATAKCRRCSSMNKKCDAVPELFVPTLHEVQRLGVSLHRKEIEKPAFSKAASKYVSNVEAYGRKSRTKTPAPGAKAGEPEPNSIADQLAKIEWRLEQLVRIGAVISGTEIPTKEDGPAGFHAGEVDDD